MADNRPRGIRNHNPGNIEKGTAWNGMADSQPDPRYITFVTPQYGIRAMARILRTYRERYKLTTIEGIISRWAPPSENPTDKYIKFVADRVGVAAGVVLPATDEIIARLIAAIIRFENGLQPYDDETILEGIKLERTV